MVNKRLTNIGSIAKKKSVINNKKRKYSYQKWGYKYKLFLFINIVVKQIILLIFI